MQCGGLSLTAVLQKYHFLLQLLKQNQMSQIDSAKCLHLRKKFVMTYSSGICTFYYVVPELHAQAAQVQIVLKRRACYFPEHSVGNNRNITL